LLSLASWLPHADAQDAQPTLHDMSMSAAWASDGHSKHRNETLCTCESPCDLNTATYVQLERLFKPLNLIKTAGVAGAVSAYNQIVKLRPLCNVMELATMKKVYVQPGYLAPPPRPNPGYLLLALWGCGGNQGLYGTVGGRGGCCPVTASSIYCGLKKLFGTKALNRNAWTKAKPDPSCVYRSDVSSKADGSRKYTPANPPPWCYTNDKFINFEELAAVAAGLNETHPVESDSMWTKAQLMQAFNKMDNQPKDGHISESEYIREMGLAHLGGLPRMSFVREPWERTQRMTKVQEQLTKCMNHHGPEKCIGNNPTRALTVDLDGVSEDKKKYPDCVMHYQKGAYELVRSGQVCCEQPTWEWEDGSKKWHQLIRGECISNPRRTALSQGTEAECLVDVSDRLNGQPEDPEGVALTTLANGKILSDGAYAGSRRRAWKRVKPVSELVQERFVVASRQTQRNRATGDSTAATTTFPDCRGRGNATCTANKNCRYHAAMMPHDSGCKSVWDIEMVLDEDPTQGLGRENPVRMEVRDVKDVEMDPPVEIRRVLTTGFWEAGKPVTYPLWWREMLAWLRPMNVKSEPSMREAIPTVCRGKRALMIFTTRTSEARPQPVPSVEVNGAANWGGVKRLRQKMHYPRWVKKGATVRCGCFPPPLSTMPTVDLYPGCAATENVCLTPPDWSQYS
jgi:hypothetical protein